ncbi:UNKNOWN [Stylonychia lemnae]|uniref:Uncharacterized protein n=1 Tax=Stylonychia lemnae TaxID=5949 RepID=A0A078A5W6_STYLE|nr:UNKNOWN [Stylonychia lemnae]|eukprot:CDW77640.1 UNKNOWN [Stylonychia lemnae]
MVTSIKNIQQQTIFKQFRYDLCFKTEDLSEEVKFKQAFGSYQQYNRSFCFNLKELWVFIDQVKQLKRNGSNNSAMISESSFASVFSNSSMGASQKNLSRSNSSLSNKQSQRLVDQLKRLKEITQYTVDNQFMENQFILEIVIQFDKSLFGVISNRQISLPINIYQKKEIIQQKLIDDLYQIYQPKLFKQNYYSIAENFSDYI